MFFFFLPLTLSYFIFFLKTRVPLQLSTFMLPGLQLYLVPGIPNNSKSGTGSILKILSKEVERHYQETNFSIGKNANK